MSPAAVAIDCSPQLRRAMPKSSTFTKSASSPRLTSITFSGLRSRCTIALRVRLADGVAELERDVERARERNGPARGARARSGATGRRGTP